MVSVSVVVIIIIILLVIILGVTIVVIITVGKHQKDDKNNPNTQTTSKYNSNVICNSQKDCPNGYVCTQDNNTKVCKAGLGTPCKQDVDCVNGLKCQENTKTCESKVQDINHRNGSISITNTKTPVFNRSNKKIISTRSLSSKKTKNFKQYTNNTVINYCNPTPISNYEGQWNPVNQDLKVSSQTNVQKPTRPVSIESDVSSDNEINSEGEFTDGPFDVRSQSTPRKKTTKKVSNNNNYKDTGVKYISTDEQNIPIIDGHMYSNMYILLVQNGDIICTNNIEPFEMDLAKPSIIKGELGTRVKNNVILQKIRSFNGYLYGLSKDGKLYTIDNHLVKNSNWIWKIVHWAPVDINFISSSHDDSCLWIQTDDEKGYLYKSTEKPCLKIPYSRNQKRIYGRDEHHYIDINYVNFTGHIQPGNVIVEDIFDAVLSYHNDVYVIHKLEREKYTGVLILNWTPYYIKKTGIN